MPRALTESECKKRLTETFVKRDEATGCLLWVRCKSGGYGNMGYKGKIWRSHRLAYTLFVGPIPDGLSVCHTCDVRACVNTEHMFLGTNADNVRDRVAKGRTGDRKGESNGHAKMNEATVLRIAALYATGRYSGKKVASMVGVGATSVFDVVKRRTWRHIHIPTEVQDG